MSPDLHHLSGAYAVDALDDAERAVFEEHLTGCPDCRAEVAELTAAAQSLAALSEDNPPPTLRASVLSGIRQVRPLAPPPDDDAGMPSTGSAVRERHPEWPAGAERSSEHRDGKDALNVVRLRRRGSTWFAAAAAAAVIAVGGLVWGPWSNPADTSPVDRVVAAEDAKRVSASAGSLRAEVAYSQGLRQGVIMLTGLPPAPDGKTYQLWYVGTDEVPRSAGLVREGSGGRTEVLLQGDPSAAAAIGMTLEPAGGSTRPTTEPLVVLPLT
jgi:anti-sigma-K factor RskA